MGSTYLDESVRRLKQFEGTVDWMYLDTVGKVTVGVGLMLPDSSAAEALAFSIGGRAATSREVAAEFSRVTSLQKGRSAKFYSRPGGLRISAETIEQKLRDTLAGFEGYLRRYLRSYDDLPDAAKVALLDMIYNLGPGKLFAEYPHLIAAVEAGDWRKAAEQSQRRGPASGRNAWTRDQFLAAARQVAGDIKAASDGPLFSWILGGFTALLVTVLALELLERTERR